MHALVGLFVMQLLAPHFPQFQKQTIANDLTDGYQVIACDVNGDGKHDLIALASGMPDLVWFENPTWQRHALAANLPHMINAACLSHGLHTVPTIAVAFEFSMRPKGESRDRFAPH